MSSRVLIEFICDECSYVETFVHLERNQCGAVASVNIATTADRRGWTIGRFEDSRLLVKNFCSVCSRARSNG